MSKKSPIDPIFLFETTDPKIVHIAISTFGKEKIGKESGHVLEDLVDNIDQNLRGAGYIYDVQLNLDTETIDIEPFEGIESFNQEVFDIISEELQFSDMLLRDEEELEEIADED